jgi:chromosome segregation ATPase
MNFQTTWRDALTSSNANLRKSTRNTKLALILGGVALAASGYLVFSVNALDQKYGRIVEDFDHYTGQLSSTRETVQLARVELGTLNDQRVKLTQQVAQANNDLRSAEQQSTDALQRRDSAQEDFAKLQDRLREAKATISEADRLRSEVTQAENKKNNLQSQIAAMRSDIEALDSDQREKRAERDLVDEAIARLTPIQNALLIDVNNLSQAKEALVATQANVDRLLAEKSRLEGAISDLSRSELEARVSLTSAREVAVGVEHEIIASKEEAAALAGTVENLRGKVANLEAQRKELEADIADKGVESTQLERRAELAVARFTEMSGSLSAETEKLTAARVSLSGARKMLEGVESEITSSKEDAAELAVSVGNLRGDVAKLETQQLTLRADIAGKSVDVTQLERRAELADARFTKVTGSLSAETERMTAARKELSELQGQISALTAQLESNRDDVARLKVVQEQVASLTLAVNALEARRTGLEAEVPNLVGAAEGAQSKIAVAQMEIAKQEQRRAELIARIATLEEEENRLQQRTESLSNDLRDVQARSEAFQNVREGLQAEEATLRAQVEAWAQQKTDLDQQVAQRKDSLRAMENAVVSELSRLNQLQAVTIPPAEGLTGSGNKPK